MVSKVTPLENPLLEAALEYVERGWPVFPCEARGKRPLTPHGFKDATTDVAAVRAWWRRWPRANVAIPTGTRTFDVLDVDGSQGEQSLAALEARHDDLPAGPRQITGTGRHLLFRGGTLGVSARRLPGLDTRGDGGYVIVAPSIHPSGERYALEDDDAAIPEPPAWLVSELRAGSRDAMGEEPAGPAVQVDDADARGLLGIAGIPLSAIGEGRRNDQLFRHGASLRARGMEMEFLLHVLRTANRLLCQPPLADDEVVRIARSAARLEVAAAYRRAEEVVARQVEREREAFAREEAVRQAPSASASESLEALREMLRVPLVAVEKRGPDYYLVLTEDRRLRLRNLLSFDEAERVIFDELGTLVAVKRKEWRAAAARLRSVAQELDAGLATETEETLHYLRNYLREHVSPPVEAEADMDELRMSGTPIIRYRGEVWFLFDPFRDYCDRLRLEGGSGTRQLWRRIREAGHLREEKNLRHAGKVVSRRYWVADAAFLEEEAACI